MIINYLILDGFKRFSLGHIERFEYRPMQKTQLILGSNGSGKSSLLGMLSPLPARSKDFKENGYKEIGISHDGSEYVLKSSYNGKHSFIRDEEELNSGGTLNVQRQLVEDIFGLNEKLFDVLSGSVNLCGMGVGERRKWFTDLSDNDYAYISDVYKNVKEELNKKSVELKTSIGVLEEARSRVLSEDEATELRSSCKAIEEEIEALQGIKTSVNNDETGLNRALQALETELDLGVGRLRRYMGSIRQDALIKDYRDYGSLCNTLDNENAADSRQLQLSIDNYEELKQSIIAGKDLDKRQLYVVEIDKLDKEINSIPDDIELDIEKLSSALESIKETVIGVLSELPENGDLTFSKANFEKTLSDLNEAESLKVKLYSDRDRLKGIINRLESILNDDPTQCPSCGFKWILGYDKDLYERSKHELSECGSRIDLVVKNIDELTNRKTEILDYFSRYRIMTQAFGTYNGLYGVYSTLQPVIQQSPSLAIQKLSEIESSYKRQLVKLGLIQKRDKLKSHYSEILKQSVENVGGMEKEIDKLERVIRTLTDKINERNKLKNIYLEQIRIYKLIDNEVDNLKKCIMNYEDKSVEYLKTNINLRVNELLKQLLSESVYNRNLLSQYNQQNSQIDMLNKSIGKLEKDIKSLKILNDVLNPKTGLIAESLVGFINQILDYITRFINSVWTYNIEIIPVEIENEDDSLDYKFKVRIDDTNDIDDISEASKGLKEMINLAFKICIMSYKQFQGYPLYLDEFGASFDALHRRNASLIIEQLIAEERFSNIFMVSHYEESYGSLQNVDTIIMHDGNICIPKEYEDSDVVKITRGM